MRQKEVLKRAFAMPLTNPAYSPGPYRFVNREYLIITYRTDAARLRAIVPEPLELDYHEPLVKYEFFRMPDSNGFGDYTESGQVIPVSFRGRRGGYTHCMFLDDEGPIAGGRELAFPRSSRSRRCGLRSIRSSAPWITVRFGSRPEPWDTSTVKPTSRKSKCGSRRRTSCLKSFRTSMVRRGSANLSNTILRTLI